MNKIIFISLLFSIFSCDKQSKVGDWSDHIKFSALKAVVSAEGGEVVITSEGKFWWFESVYFDDEHYPCGGCMENGIHEPASNSIITQYCGNVSSNPNVLETVQIETPWFTITKETPLKLVFYVSSNDSKKHRTLRLNIQGGNYFTGIDIEQFAE